MEVIPWFFSEGSKDRAIVIFSSLLISSFVLYVGPIKDELRIFS
jgi:hypothetical protein